MEVHPGDTKYSTILAPFTLKIDGQTLRVAIYYALMFCLSVIHNVY